MRCKHFFAVLSGLVAVALLAADASATYHPTLGRWLQRDPIGYADGLGLYLYAAAAPLTHRDSQGLAASQETVRLEVEEIEGGGGSVELYPDGGSRTVVAATPEQSSVVLDVLMLLRRVWHGVGASLGLEKSGTGTSFGARLTVSLSAGRPRLWQVCPRYSWRLKVRNICCTSGKVELHSNAKAGLYALAQAPTGRSIPLGVGGVEELSPHMVVQVNSASWGKTPFEAKALETHAAATVSVTCEE